MKSVKPQASYLNWLVFNGSGIFVDVCDGSYRLG